jgi:hypothetical protein
VAEPSLTTRTEAERHPIAWFSALLRGVDRDDPELIDRARRRLDALGYRVDLRSDALVLAHREGGRLK